MPISPSPSTVTIINGGDTITSRPGVVSPPASDQEILPGSADPRSTGRTLQNHAAALAGGLHPVGVDGAPGFSENDGTIPFLSQLVALSSGQAGDGRTQDIDMTNVGSIVGATFNPAGPAIDYDGFDLEVQWRNNADIPFPGTIEVFSWDGGVNREVYIQYDALVWHFGAVGADVLTISGFVDPNEYQWAQANDLISARFWYWPKRGWAGAQLGVNGNYQPAKLVYVSAAIANTPTIIYVGSNRGSIVNPISGNFERFTLRPFSSTPKLSSGGSSITTNMKAERAAQICVLGDSISIAGTLYRAPGSTIYDLSQARYARPIGTIARSGNTTSQQKAEFLASRYNRDQTVKAFILQPGVNDAITLNANAILDYQDLVNTIRDRCPNAKIICSLMTPQSQPTFSAAQIAIYNSIQNALLGGAIPYDALVTSHYYELGGGAGLLPAYDSGDHIHPNNAGRTVNGAAWRTTLQSLGIL